MRLWTPFLCAKFQGDRSTRLRFIAIFASVRKDEEEKKRRKKKRNFGRSYLGNGLSDFLQIWNVDSPSWRATLQQIWFQSDKLSPRYKSVKMTFLSSCQYTHGVARRLLGPHDTLSCVLIYIYMHVGGICLCVYLYMYHSAWAVQRHHQCHNLYIALLQTAASAL